MIWNTLDNLNQIEAIKERSQTVPCLLFKHSTRCEISSIAKFRLEQQWENLDNTVEPYYLDLIAHRNISGFLAETFNVHHESPQILLIHQGECIFDASHLDISVEEINEVLVF
jgi:bacillithiol system protein YtxJ